MHSFECLSSLSHLTCSITLWAQHTFLHQFYNGGKKKWRPGLVRKKFKDTQLINSNTKIQTQAYLMCKFIHRMLPLWASLESLLSNKDAIWNASVSAPDTKPPWNQVNVLNDHPSPIGLAFSWLWSSARAMYNRVSKRLESQTMLCNLSLVSHLLSFVKQITKYTATQNSSINKD